MEINLGPIESNEHRMERNNVRLIYQDFNILKNLINILITDLLSIQIKFIELWNTSALRYFQ